MYFSFKIKYHFFSKWSLNENDVFEDAKPWFKLCLFSLQNEIKTLKVCLLYPRNNLYCSTLQQCKKTTIVFANLEIYAFKGWLLLTHTLNIVYLNTNYLRMSSLMTLLLFLKRGKQFEWQFLKILILPVVMTG